MPVKLKSPRQIRRLRDSGRIVAEAFEHIRGRVVPGVTTGELDRICEEFIRARGAIPIYKGYGGRAGRQNDPGRRPFPASICVAIDSVVCHGIPSPNRELRDGEIVGIDIGLSYKGWVGDSCKTFAIGPIDGETQRLLDVTRQCLERGIEQVRPGARVGDIGAAHPAACRGTGILGSARAIGPRCRSFASRGADRPALWRSRYRIQDPAGNGVYDRADDQRRRA